MSLYSPAKDGSNDRPLANLIVESWRKADSLYPSLQLGRFDAFMIFHAGVGRDIDLVSLLGYDPTPYDIPSLTFNLQTFRNYLSDPAYAGIPVGKGAFRITNTMLLPETETRPLQSGTVIDTLQGSINGLLANSFGSYLGLPDLFNTKTGASGIGDFGLMDVAGSINFYRGLFPPEPSAWEKVYLGWVTPITIGPGTSTISLPAVGLKTGSDTVYKIPVSDREYFLIENRSRDSYRNGQRLTVRQGKSIITRYFPGDTTGFSSDDVSSIVGSVIDVEDFDWALPGFTGGPDAYVGGGVLIWHIDEDVITRGLVDNSVNADPSHRGVSLEEADGSQDIGRSYNPYTDAGAGTEFGWPLDFWFDGNTVNYIVDKDTINFYKNVFDRDSHPNSRSYTGALSHVTIRGFARRSPRMTATVDIGSNQIRRLQGFARSISVKTAVTTPSASPAGILLGIDGKVYAWKPDGSSKSKDPSGLLAPKGGAFAMAATDFGSGLLIVGAQDSSVFVLTTTDENADGLVDSVQSTTIPLGDRVTTPAMFADLSISPSILIGSARGTVWSFSYTGALQRKLVVSSSPVSSLTQLPLPSLSKPAEMFFACGGRLHSEQSSVALGDSAFPWIIAGAVSRSGNYVAAAQLGGQRVSAFTRDLGQKLFDVAVNEGVIASIATADIDGDGEKDVVVLTGGRVYAMNRAGAMIARYPLSAPNGDRFVGGPLIGDVNGDGVPELILSLVSGEVAAYDRDTHLIDGFPVQVASSGGASLAMFQSPGGKVGIVGITTTGSLQAVEINKPYDTRNVVWSQYLKDARHSNCDAAAGPALPAPTEFLPQSRVYNWPNPVYGSSTQIRDHTPEDASISIKIFDLAGTKIAELKTMSKGGLDGEVTWDVSSVQSGVYLARIEAAGSSRSEVAIVKIAVVK